MLVLSRKLGETIVINGEIEVTVVEIGHGKIRLGIQADRGIPIYRKELLPIREQQERERKEKGDDKPQPTGHVSERGSA